MFGLEQIKQDTQLLVRPGNSGKLKPYFLFLLWESLSPTGQIEYGIITVALACRDGLSRSSDLMATVTGRVEREGRVSESIFF